MKLNALIHKIAALLVLLGWLLAGGFFGLVGVNLEFVSQKKEEIFANAEKQKDELEIALAMETRNAAKDSLQGMIDEIDAETFDQIQAFIRSQTIGPKWIYELPDFVLLIFTACAFGALGGVVRVVFDWSHGKHSYSLNNAFLLPLLGMLTGILVLGVSEFLPHVFVEGEVAVRNSTLIFLSIFTGVFSKQFYLWLEKTFSQYLSSKTAE